MSGLGWGALWGVLTGLPVVALLNAGERLAGLPFVPFDVFDWLARVLPGAVITAGIDAIVALVGGLRLGPTDVTAKLIEQSLALGQFLLAGAALGLAVAILGRERGKPSARLGAAVGVALLIPVLRIEASLGFRPAGALASALWLAALFALWGAGTGWMLERVTPVAGEPSKIDRSRRAVFYLAGGGLVSLVLSSTGISRLGGQTRPATPGEEVMATGGTSGPAPSPRPSVLAARIQPAPGTRPELTPNNDFYRIDINTRVPRIDSATWRLGVGGLVRNPLSLTLEDLRAFPSVTQIITLSCISNPVGGDLISTSRWTGVPLRTVLDEAGLEPGAQEVSMSAADGFYESVALADAEDLRTLLVYEMNGLPLPLEHGFPLRVYIPNRYGMKQPKWLTGLEVLDGPGRGYWVDRGWSKEATALSNSAVDVVAPADERRQRLVAGGIAWAGERGISKVEVQVNGGPWQETELRAPPLSPLTWVQWRYQGPYQAGKRHTVAVRAYDGRGQLQALQPHRPHPHGATGVHSLTERL